MTTFGHQLKHWLRYIQKSNYCVVCITWLKKKYKVLWCNHENPLSCKFKFCISDNVAAVLLGGFTFVREKNDIIKLNSPIGLAFTILHPQIEVKTSDSRALIKKIVSLEMMVKQSANLGAFVSGLYTEDYELIGRSMKDLVIEPFRSILIPKFKQIKSASINTGAIGCGISGSGPSVFALSKGFTTAKNVENAMKKIYDNLDLDYDVHISFVNDKGIKIIKTL